MNYKKYILKELQELQSVYLNDIDIDVSVRKDLNGIGIRFCAYKYDFEKEDFIDTSKLYSYFIKFNSSEIEIENILQKIREDLVKIYSMYVFTVINTEVN